MSSGLEAFKEVIKIYGETNSLEGTYDLFLKIKKELMTLDIIKNKRVNVADEIFDMSNYTEYITYCSEESYAEEYQLTKGEFNLLKEELCDE